jgi:hypothetical protein
MQKGGKRKKSAWMVHVANTMAQMPNVALREVLKAASKTYKKGKGVTGKALLLKKRKKRRRTRRRTKRRKRRRRTRRRTRRRVRRRKR